MLFSSCFNFSRASPVQLSKITASQGQDAISPRQLVPSEYRIICRMVGLERLELSTSRLSGVRSNHLSYRPGPCLSQLTNDRNLSKSGRSLKVNSERDFSLKEVIQPQVPLRLPCYDFTPIIGPTVDGCFHCWFAHRLRVKPTFVV